MNLKRQDLVQEQTEKTTANCAFYVSLKRIESLRIKDIIKTSTIVKSNSISVWHNWRGMNTMNARFTFVLLFQLNVLNLQAP